MTEQKTTETKSTQQVASTGAFANLSKKNKTILGVVGAIVVAIGLFFAWQQFIVKPADDKVQAQLNTAQLYLAEAQQTEGRYQYIASLNDSALTKQLQQAGMLSDSISADSTAKVVKNYRSEAKTVRDMAYNRLLKGEQKFPGLLKMAEEGGKGGNIATYLAGLAYYYLNNYKEAIKYLENFSPKGDAIISAQALCALANCYAADKQTEKAIETFKEAAEEADNAALSPQCLVQAAMLLESLNKKAEAHEIYVQVKKDYPAYGQLQQASASSIDQYIERTK